MLGEKIRSLFRPGGEPPLNGAVVLAHSYNHHAATMSSSPSEMDRRSNGLRQFFENLPQDGRLRVLDLGGVSQANVNFIALRGHKLYTEDLLVSLDHLNAHTKDPAQRAGLAARFVEENLDFPPEHFDGILVWDTLEFLDEDLLWSTVTQLQAILKPGGTILSFFHTQAKGEPVHVFRYQIADHQTLHLQPRFSRPLPRAFNNRNLERLFGNFRSVKFFLTRDRLREVIVKR